MEAAIGEIEVITRPVGALEANCHIVVDGSERRGFVVDPGGDPEVITAALDALGAGIEVILVTHGHHDHLGAAPELAEATGAPILGSSEVEAVLADPERYRLFPGMPEVKPAVLARVLEDGDIVEAGGMSVGVTATPGHTPGSLSFSVEGMLFTGDLLFHGSVGRTDLPGGSFEELVASIRKLNGEFPPETVVHPGHGNETTLANEKANNIFLADIDW